MSEEQRSELDEILDLIPSTESAIRYVGSGSDSLFEAGMHFESGEEVEEYAETLARKVSNLGFVNTADVELTGDSRTVWSIDGGNLE